MAIALHGFMETVLLLTDQEYEMAPELILHQVVAEARILAELI
jgi:hypothetical protein